MLGVHVLGLLAELVGLGLGLVGLRLELVAVLGVDLHVARLVVVAAGVWIRRRVCRVVLAGVALAVGGSRATGKPPLTRAS